jgi:hypothetical protein
MAHKLARLIYRMLKFGADYVDKGIEAYESRYRQQQMNWLIRQAAALILQLVPSSVIIECVSGDCLSQKWGPVQAARNRTPVKCEQISCR